MCCCEKYYELDEGTESVGLFHCSFVSGFFDLSDKEVRSFMSESDKLAYRSNSDWRKLKRAKVVNRLLKLVEEYRDDIKGKGYCGTVYTGSVYLLHGNGESGFDIRTPMSNEIFETCGGYCNSFFLQTAGGMFCEEDTILSVRETKVLHSRLGMLLEDLPPVYSIRYSASGPLKEVYCSKSGEKGSYDLWLK